MPVLNRIADFQADIAGWRHDFHAHPELLYDVHRTAAAVETLLRQFGCDEVVTGIGRTGVVGVINGRGDGKVVGLRADMDCLPITELTGKPYASTVPGKMHACGHDGHTAMLLGAAKYLAETRNFAGKVVLIFQPAEEGGGGGREMIRDGLLERFGIDEVYGMHNMPGIPLGEFAIREGGIMAATDQFTIDIEGLGGHAAMPHNTIDPIVLAAQLITAMQTVVSRNVNPLRPAVVSVTVIQAGEAFNVIPRTVKIKGTLRALDTETREFLPRKLGEFVPAFAASFGASAKFSYLPGYPATIKSPVETRFAAEVARDVVGRDRVDDDADPTMGGEDFSFMLEKRPGAYIFLGNGDSSQLHTDTYDFNDEAIPYGTSFWVRLVEKALPVA